MSVVCDVIEDDDPEDGCDCETCQSGGDCQAPHAHVYVGTDRGDECEICGKVEVPDEWAYWNWRDAEDGIDEERGR